MVFKNLNEASVYPVRRMTSHFLFAEVEFPLVLPKIKWVLDR